MCVVQDKALGLNYFYFKISNNLLTPDQKIGRCIVFYLSVSLSVVNFNRHYKLFEIVTSFLHDYSTNKALPNDTKGNDLVTFVTFIVTFMLKIAFCSFCYQGHGVSQTHTVLFMCYLRIESSVENLGPAPLETGYKKLDEYHRTS